MPFVLTQGTKSHRFSEAKQKNPVVPSQSAVPQAQSAELAVEPSVLEQVAKRLHRSLLDVSQKNPVADVQAAEAPQPQGLALFSAVPSLFVQTGPVKVHRQAMAHPSSQF